MILFRFDCLSIVYIFGSYLLHVVFFACGSRVWEPSVPDRTRYRVSYILRLEKQRHVHHLEHFQARKSRIAIESRYRLSSFSGSSFSWAKHHFQGLLTSIRDPRVQEILVITKPNVMSHISFLFESKCWPKYRFSNCQVRKSHAFTGNSEIRRVAGYLTF